MYFRKIYNYILNVKTYKHYVKYSTLRKFPHGKTGKEITHFNSIAAKLASAATPLDKIWDYLRQFGPVILSYVICNIADVIIWGIVNGH